MSTLTGIGVTDPALKANLNGNTLSTVESVTYLGVTFPNNAKWTTHVEDIFRNFESYQCPLSLFANFSRRAYYYLLSIVPQPSSPCYLNTALLCLSAQINESVKYVV